MAGKRKDPLDTLVVILGFVIVLSFVDVEKTACMVVELESSLSLCIESFE